MMASGETPTDNESADPGESTAATVQSAPSTKRLSAPASLRAFPVPGWDRYRIVAFLGAGGMGRVFKAEDPRLHRFVALKLIRGDDPELIRRFLREAQAQARIEHDNICKVYEVGEAEGHPYIAMQYIPGDSLKEAKDRMTLEQKVEVMRKVASGLHAAHRIGLIHRDIKPANIMLERSEDGVLHPYVMDFGLAREAHADGQTMTGTIEGTPAYMAPEQARGELSRLDRRTDVYSLGATLYDLLGGRPPFSGVSGLEIMLALVSEEPAPIRTLYNGVPADLETIVMKCLEKEPTSRYESAKALADDLQRYLDGEPVSARRAGLGYRLAKRAKKHKLVVAISSAALVSIGLLGGAWIRAKVSASEQAILSQQLGQDVKEMETFLRLAYSLPLHDTRREKAVIRERMAGIQRRMGQLAALGDGPGHYALGRGHLALHEYKEALEHLEAAYRGGYRGGEVAQALGQTLGELYKKALNDAQRIEEKGQRGERVKEAEKTYLEPALRYLQESGGSRSESQAYIEGLIALYEKRREEALTKAKQAFNESPWLYEAKELEGDVHFVEGNEARARGDYKAALVSYRLATEALRTAADIARSDADIHDAEAAVWIEIIDAELRLGTPPQSSLDQALTALDCSLAANPNRGGPYSKKAQALFRMAHYQFLRSEDPTTMADRALEAANEAVRMDPKDALAFDLICAIYLEMSQHEIMQGKNPQDSFRRAEESCKAALEADPSFSWGWNDLGAVYSSRAFYELSHGADPSEPVRHSADAYERAISASPRSEDPYLNTCFALSAGAQYALEHGRDPRQSLRQALEAGGEAVKVAPGYHMAHTNISLAYLLQSQYELDVGLDPLGSAERAIESAATAIKLNPTDIEAERYAVAAHHIKALHALARGSDPTESLRSAMDHAQKIAAVAPKEPQALRLRGAVELSGARWEIHNGRSPRDAIHRARAALEQALKVNSNDAETFHTLADLHRVQAERPAQQKRDIEADVAQGLSAVDKALSVNPHMARAMATRGALHLATARAERAARARKEAADRAKASLEEALRENSNLERELRPLLDEAKRLKADAPAP